MDDKERLVRLETKVDLQSEAQREADQRHQASFLKIEALLEKNHEHNRDGIAQLNVAIKHLIEGKANSADLKAVDAKKADSDDLDALEAKLDGCVADIKEKLGTKLDRVELAPVAEKSEQNRRTIWGTVVFVLVAVGGAAMKLILGA